MNVYIDIRKNAYFDSVTLMLLSRKLLGVSGVLRANVCMGSEHNKMILNAQEFLDSRLDHADANDLIIALMLESQECLQPSLDAIKEHFSPAATNDELETEFLPRTQESALKIIPDANLALISTPGEFAFWEARKALRNGLHVMIFSDNVSVKEEMELKNIAKDKKLLLMGPDCRTAIINGKPLAFANAVRRGEIGLIGASGTGIQEVSVCIHKLGFGVSQAIGTGGRDLKKEIGATTMLMAFEALEKDENTKVIVLISNPPEISVEARVLSRVRNCKKPVVVSFVGGQKDLVERSGGIYAPALESAAILACKAITPELDENIFSSKVNIFEIAGQEREKYLPEQKFIRGLYTGGTLCKEAIVMLRDYPVFSNIPASPNFFLTPGAPGKENTILDLGEDEFTRGRPHPMIDPESRTERLFFEAKDPSIRVFLFDVMLGYGSHHDPAGALCLAIEKIRKSTPEKHMSFLCSICGVEGDPQVYSRQEEKLKNSGLIVLPTNAQAVKLACLLMQESR